MSFHKILEELSPLKNRFKICNTAIQDNKYVETQKRAEKLLQELSGLHTIPAHEHGPSCLDGFLSDGKEFRCGYEIKTREVPLYQMAKWGSLLISKSKVDNCIEVCKRLCIPFIVVFYSIPDEQIRYWFISDDEGNLYNTLKSTMYTAGGKTEEVYFLRW